MCRLPNEETMKKYLALLVVSSLLGCNEAPGAEKQKSDPPKSVIDQSMRDKINMLLLSQPDKVLELTNCLDKNVKQAMTSGEKGLDKIGSYATSRCEMLFTLVMTRAFLQGASKSEVQLVMMA